MAGVKRRGRSLIDPTLRNIACGFRRCSADLGYSRLWLANRPALPYLVKIRMSTGFMTMKSPRISRRSALKRMSRAFAGGALAGVLIPEAGVADKASEMTVTVLLNEAIGVIKPTSYSH